MVIMSKKRRTFDVFVGNLPPTASEKSLSPLFTELGEVSAIIVKNCKKNDGTRIAFVQYLCEPDADTAVQCVNGQYFEGRQLNVSRSRRSEGQGQQNLLLGGFTTNGIHATIGRSRIQGLPTMARCAAAPPCSDESLVICHVKDVTSFYGQRLADVVRLNKLSNDLEEFCCTAPRLCAETPDFQKMYACQYSDDKAWYRCKVLKQLDNDQSFVQYVDFGNCEAVKRAEMVPLKGELASQDPLALCCRLDGLFGIRRDDDPFLYAQAMREIGDLLQEQCVHVQMKRATASGIHFLVRCQLERSGKDLAEELIRWGYAKVVGLQLGIQTGMMSGGHPMWTPPSYSYPFRQEPSSYFEYSSVNARDARAVGHEATHQKGENDQSGKRNFSQSQGKPKEVPQVRLLKPNKLAKQQENDIEQPCTSSMTKLTDRLNNMIKLRDDRIQFLENELEKQKNSREDNHFLSKMSKILELTEMAREQRNQFYWLHAVQQAMAAHAACNETARTVLNTSQVEDSWARFQTAQKNIQQCKDKDTVGPLVEERNLARACLERSITSFVVEADRYQGDQDSSMVPPGVSATVALAQKALKDLDSILKPFLHGASSHTPRLSLEQVHELYECTKSSLQTEFSMKRTKTDVAQEHLRQSLQSLTEATCMSEREAKVGFSFGHLEACLSNLQHSLSDEVASCNLIGSSLHEPLSQLTLQLKEKLSDALERISDMAQQRARYAKLLETLSPFPRCLAPNDDSEMMDVASEWALVDDLVKELKEKRQAVRQLKSQLRHSLADMEDIESRTSPEWKEAVEVVHHLREQVLSAFQEEDTFMIQVTTLREKHFPELSLLYPELEIDAYLSSKGLLKSSWELCAFQGERFLTRACFKSSYGGAQVTIKEHVVESEESRQELLFKAVEWSVLGSQYLLPLKAIFISKDGHKVYLMSPWQQSSILASFDSPSKELGGKLVQAILGGLAALHSIGRAHGGVHPSSILVCGEDAPLLDVPNFTARMGELGTLNGIDPTAPELRIPGARPTPEGDMYALGCTLLWLCFPRNMFQITAQGTPNLYNLPKPLMDDAILKLSKDLLKSDPNARPKAAQLLSSWKASPTKNSIEEVERDYPKIESSTSDSGPSLLANFSGSVMSTNAAPLEKGPSDDNSLRKLCNNWAPAGERCNVSIVPDQVPHNSLQTKVASSEQLFSSKDKPLNSISETLLDLELDVDDLEPIDNCPVHLGSGDSTAMGVVLLQRALACDSPDSSEELPDYVACSAPQLNLEEIKAGENCDESLT